MSAKSAMSVRRFFVDACKDNNSVSRFTESSKVSCNCCVNKSGIIACYCSATAVVTTPGCRATPPSPWWPRWSRRSSRGGTWRTSGIKLVNNLTHNANNNAGEKSLWRVCRNMQLWVSVDAWEKWYDTGDNMYEGTNTFVNLISVKYYPWIGKRSDESLWVLSWLNLLTFFLPFHWHYCCYKPTRFWNPPASAMSVQAYFGDLILDQKVSCLVTFWHEWSAFGRSTGNNVSGHYKRNYFPPPLFLVAKQL